MSEHEIAAPQGDRARRAASCGTEAMWASPPGATDTETPARAGSRRGAMDDTTASLPLPLAASSSEIAGHHHPERHIRDARKRRPAKRGLDAGSSLPDGAEIAGHSEVANQSGSARKRGGATGHTTTNGRPPLSAPIPEIGEAQAKPRRRAIPDAATITAPPGAEDIEGQLQDETHAGIALDGEALTGLAPTYDRLRALQRQRQFCITSQSRIDRACESFIARVIGFDAGAEEKARKEVFKRASDFRREVEKAGGGGQCLSGNPSGRALSACVPIVINSAIARAAWDGLRDQAEKEMRRLAKTLPAYPWVQSVRGFGDLGFAIVCAETGDLTTYATKERVWKRLGLAVMDGIRQQRRSNAEEAAAHGYSPKRRAEVWTVADSMFRAQWRGARDDAPAHALGPYGEVYARRKTQTSASESRGWTPKHIDNDARRIMTKRLIEDLWRVSCGKAPLGTALRDEEGAP